MFDMGNRVCADWSQYCNAPILAHWNRKEERDMHVVDATLFYSPTSGGVKRYLLAKHEWMRAHTNWRHSLVVPASTSRSRPATVSIGEGAWFPARSTTACR
jgi:hypothetical protein